MRNINMQYYTENSDFVEEMKRHYTMVYDDLMEYARFITNQNNNQDYFLRMEEHWNRFENYLEAAGYHMYEFQNYGAEHYGSLSSNLLEKLRESEDYFRELAAVSERIVNTEEYNHRTFVDTVSDTTYLVEQILDVLGEMNEVQM